MTNYKEFPFSIINNFIADYLESKDVMKRIIAIKGKQQPSIVPSAQTPELVDAFSPGDDRAPAFMVYGFELDQDDNEPWKDCETLSYTVFAPMVSKVLEVIYAMRDLFGRDSWSAQDINSFYMQKNPGKEPPFVFLETSYELVAGPIPMTNEGGRYGAMLTVHYVYTYPVNGTPGPGQGMRV